MKRITFFGGRRTAAGLAVATAVIALGIADPASPGDVGSAPSADPAAFASLATAFLEAPTDPARAHALRLAARSAGQLDSAIALFQAALAREPGALPACLELGLAHVDQLAAPDLDLKQRFVLAGQAIGLFSEVLKADPAHWAARYARGMTHVLFPRQSRHSDPAVNDLERLLHQQKTMEWRSYFVLAHIGLGDAYVVNKQKSLAHDTWAEGKKLYGDQPELNARLKLAPADMDSAVSTFRSLERPFDTDLSFLWAAP